MHDSSIMATDIRDVKLKYAIICSGIDEDHVWSLREGTPGG
jgi:hypothetical protein